MSISHAINAAQSGLKVSGLRADIVATNVANASTPGYVRRSVLVDETLLGGRTSGVAASGISRSADSALSAERRSISSDVAQSSLMSSTWQVLSSRIGDDAEGTGLFSKFSKFEAALSASVTSPESSTQLAALLDSANAVVTELNNLSQLVSQQRSEADREIADGVNVVNAALKQVEELNGLLAGMDRSTSQAAALMDDRDRTLDTIAEYLPIEAIPRDGGVVDVITVEGVYLVAGTAKQLEFSPANSFGADMTLDNGALSGLSVNGQELTPGASSYAAISSGMFGALFTLRDTDLPNFGAQLDTIANDLVTRLSDDSIDPTKVPGEFGLFVDTGTPGDPGLAGRIDLNAQVDPAQGGSLWRLRDGIGAAVEGPPGDNSILSAMSNAFTKIQSMNSNGIQGGFSATELVAHVASLTGQTRISHESVLSSASTQHDLLIEAELSETGVDIDSQMQDLLAIEQAYAANARVIEIANQMMQKLMEI
ncbi:flagellar hook-associated protein FlgK [uncultured Hyphomonas sp.]|uniref:flagellar hook-associated protein FlgK n=1 Tax=uncultured Hyphomonas sp. TaxID=225298 RepID=UPI002638BFD1|nr:flagellar hook-associated protein FlgK [uncultured Hyphomonas sp.]